MKNIHLLATENYKQDYTTMRGEVLEVVRLGQLIVNKETGELLINKNPQWAASCDTDILVPHHIYITSDEEVKEGDWCYYENEDLKGIHKVVNVQRPWIIKTIILKKIILTTDQNLINNGVQPIDDEFLEWFIKNPSCEFVDVKLNSFGECHGNDCSCFNDGDQKVCIFYYPDYKTIIPKEEPKQETLEEAAEIFYSEQSKAFEDAIESMFDNSRYLVAGFIDGAKWQAERMYSEEELRNAMNWMLTQYFEFHEQPTTGRIDHYIQSLKQ